MRISDWSSDVCSSDLLREADGVSPLPPHRLAGGGAGAGGDRVRRVRAPVERRPQLPGLADLLRSRRVADRRQRSRRPRRQRDPPGGGAQGLARTAASHEDRKSVVSGKRVSVRVDLGGSRINKKQKKK